MTAIAPDAPARQELPSGPRGTSRWTLLLTFRSSAAGAVVGTAVNLAIVPFVLHRVESETYGAWATMSSILAVGALADAGIRTEIVRRVGSAQGEGDQGALVRSAREGLTLLVVLAGLVTVAGWLAAPAIRSFALPHGASGYGPAHLDLVVRATFALLAASLVANGYIGVLRGMQRGDVEANGTMIAVPASALVTVTGVLLGWDLWALFLGSLAGVSTRLVWNLAGARRLAPGVRLRLVTLTLPVVKGYLALSCLALVSQVGDVVDSQWDKVVLSRYVGSAAVTSFQIGTSLVLQGKALALLPLAPLLVAIAELRRRDPDRMEMLYGLMARAGMVLGSVVLSAIFVFAPAFVQLWLDGDASAPGAATAARLFTVAVALNLVTAAFAFRAFGEGWHRLAALGAAANMVTNALASFGLTVAIGFEGALYGSIAGNAAGTLVFLVLMKRRLGDRWVRPPWKALAVGVLAASLMVVTGLDRVGGELPLAVAGLLYTGVVVATCSAAERLPWREVHGLLRQRRVA